MFTFDLKKICAKKFNPNAWMTSILFNPNISGINQFHKKYVGNANKSAYKNNTPITPKTTPNSFII